MFFHQSPFLGVRTFAVVPVLVLALSPPWAESGPNTGAEHNVIVVTAKGQPFGEGILLDLWRYSGALVWTHVDMDPDYRWIENKSEIARRLRRTQDIASKQISSSTKSN